MMRGLSQADRTALLSAAREAIAVRLEGRAPSRPEFPESCSFPSGAFVTLRERGTLRGCIGRMWSTQALGETIVDMAEAAAFEDPRFDPVTLRELPEISIEITVLSPMRKVSSPDEIEVGKHGIYLVSGGRSGVLLPQVAVEYGWDRTMFLRQTCLKAGLPDDAWLRPGTEILVFEGTVFGE